MQHAAGAALATGALFYDDVATGAAYYDDRRSCLCWCCDRCCVLQPQVQLFTMVLRAIPRNSCGSVLATVFCDAFGTGPAFYAGRCNVLNDFEKCDRFPMTNASQCM